MIAFLARRHHIMSGLVFTGLFLMLASAGLFFARTVPTAQAENCSGHPLVGSGNTYATNWKVNKWLALDGVPIGPSSWKVMGRYKNASSETCFEEAWTLKKVVMASSRLANRGLVINATSSTVTIPELDKSLLRGDRVLNFNLPVTQANQTARACQGGLFGIGGSCQELTFPQDSAFGATNGDSAWNPTGLYGALRDSSQDLKFSRSFYPLEWQVDGRF